MVADVAGYGDVTPCRNAIDDVAPVLLGDFDMWAFAVAEGATTIASSGSSAISPGSVI
jgi:hypothetical protein